MVPSSCKQGGQRAHDRSGRIFLGRNLKKTAGFLEELCAKTKEECGLGKYEDSLQDIRRGPTGIDAEFGEHDGDDMVPVVEEEPVQKSRQFLEEGDAGAVAKAEGAIARISSPSWHHRYPEGERFQESGRPNVPE